MSCEYCGLPHVREVLCAPRQQTRSRRWFLGSLPALVAGAVALPKIAWGAAGPPLLPIEAITKQALMALETTLRVNALRVWQDYLHYDPTTEQISFAEVPQGERVLIYGRRGGKTTSLIDELERRAEQGDDGTLYLASGAIHRYSRYQDAGAFKGVGFKNLDFSTLRLNDPDGDPR